MSRTESCKLLNHQDFTVKKGGLTLRLADSAEEVLACQKLRYRVFYEELTAQPDDTARIRKVDADRFDDFCDHLLVVHNSGEFSQDPLFLHDGELVGTYRLLRHEVAAKHGGFYTQDEFDIAPVIAAHPALRFLELGRSCVLRPYRTKPVVELLWQGIWNYVRAHAIAVMLGCASLEGTNIEAHADVLSFLGYNRPAPPEWQVRALPARRVEMGLIAPGSLDRKAALRKLPPLIKGYLRLGCYIGDGAIIDTQFNTTDVLIVLPVSAIDTRYFGRFGRPND